MSRISRLSARNALKASRFYASGLARVFMTEPVFLWAQAIAFKTLVTLLPLILLATGIFGMVLREEETITAVSSFLRDFLPPSQSDGLIELIFSLQKSSQGLTVVGAIFFVVTVLTLFTTLRFVIAEAMGEKRHQIRSLLKGYLFDLRMAAQVGVLFLASFLITTSVRLLSARTGQMADMVGLEVGVVEAATGGLVQIVSIVVPYLLTVGMLAQLYYFVPRPKTPSRSAFVGAAAGAVLFELAKNGFAVYATYLADFDRYRGDESEGLSELGGAFGLILAFVFWVYFSGFILVIGAIVTKLHEKRTHPRRSRLRKMWARLGFHSTRQRIADEQVSNANRPEPSPDLEVGGDGAPASTIAKRARQRAEAP
ncbi:YihY/virulence factor BrkB family protein [Rubrivirga sp.]|uniref:YihY/virulence factor BrkB family protein n=1 Tax=Rubrivirga sp. TaxID=1885344 RepID=UPI003C715658